MFDMVLRDDITINIYLTDGEGGIHEDSGSEYLTPTVVIGSPWLLPTGGTFSIGLQSDTKETLGIPYNATEAQIKAAFDEVVGYSAEDITVTGGPGRYAIEFGGDWAYTDPQVSSIKTNYLTPPSWATFETMQAASAPLSRNNITLVTFGQLPLVSVEAEYVESDHWVATLDLSSPMLVFNMEDLSEMQHTFEVELDGAYGYEGNQTILQMPVTIFSDIRKYDE